MKNYSSNLITRACSLVVTLALVLSVVIIPASAVSVKDMNPTDDPLLGTQFAVDAVIPLVSTGDGKDVSLTVPVQGVSKDALEAAIAAGQVSISLDRDATRPYVNEELYPNAYEGGALDQWMTQKDGEQEFTDLQLSASEADGAVVLNVSFHVNNNDGRRDLHLTPDIGEIDWAGTHDYIRSKGYTGTFVLEINGHNDGEKVLAHMAGLFEKGGNA